MPERMRVDLRRCNKKRYRDGESARRSKRRAKQPAGVLLVLEPKAGKPLTLVMHKGDKGVSDFGGKTEPTDLDVWQTRQLATQLDT